MSEQMSVRRRAFLLGVAILLLDQLAKWWVLARLSGGRVIEILPVLDFRLVWNTGISMGLLQDGGWPLTLMVVVVTAVVAWWLWQARGGWEAWSLGAVLGGALGNLIDRLRFGAVVDFVHFHLGGWSFYIFNLADAALTLGAIGLVVAMLHPAHQASPAGK